MKIGTARERLAVSIGILFGAAATVVMLTTAVDAPILPIVSSALLGLVMFWLLSLPRH